MISFRNRCCVGQKVYVVIGPSLVQQGEICSIMCELTTGTAMVSYKAKVGERVIIIQEDDIITSPHAAFAQARP